MAKILNLDALAPKITRELRLKGKSYEVREMSVEDFIESSRIAESLEGNHSLAAQMEASMTLIKRSVPDIDEGDLRGLNMAQLAAVARFVRGEDPEEVVEDGESGNA